MSFSQNLPLNKSKPSHSNIAIVDSDDSIRQLLYALNANIASLGRMLQNDPDIHRLDNLIQSTQQLIKQITPQIDKNSVGGAKLGKDFQGLLVQFQSLQKRAANQTRSRQQVAVQSLNDEAEEQGESTPLVQQQVLKEREQSLLIEEREVAIEHLERSILEVNEIFRDLGTLVTEQSSLVDNIESNLENTRSRMGDATLELGQAERYQKKSRNRMFCLFGVAVFVLVILIIVLTTKR